ncbi:hypothetical protein MMP96_23175 [Enterobacter hormaechei]|uniref:hypothetical protein n=1 Tax=Enterobacter hormaechei TaxID=158836 RepID=UPI001F4D6725|nr:hypothetical protein [Enterobacter hormaechei]MCH9331850.1 hypothetical protein [Enterobacter hormaechei]MCH9428256.1 hypothetical protein [Enterobacter hormaechei]MCU2452021.1 hypothetical protein [Enterobacter hormaechei subsp. hoffmannii]
MNKKHYSVAGILIALSAVVGWEVRPVDVAHFAHDELTIIEKNLDKSCLYAIHEKTLFAVCPQ